jgi:hypothetical protein
MRNNKLLRRRLFFSGVVMGGTMLVASFFGFVIGFIANVFMFIGVILYIQIKETKELGFNEERRGDYYGDTSSSSRGFEIKPSYTCLVCGNNVNETECRKCGSRTKKAVFK